MRRAIAFRMGSAQGRPAGATDDTFASPKVLCRVENEGIARRVVFEVLERVEHCRQDPGGAHSRRADAVTAATPTARPLDRLHVLVVDDDEDALAIAAAVLAQAGAVVETARSADAAIACVDRAMPDVVVADLMMPGRSGEELLVALRDRDEDLPIVAVSAAADWSNRDALRRVGFDDVVAKPIDFAAFVRIVAEAVGSSEASDDVDRPPELFPSPRRSGTVPRSQRVLRTKRRLRTA